MREIKIRLTDKQYWAFQEIAVEDVLTVEEKIIQLVDVHIRVKRIKF